MCIFTQNPWCCVATFGLYVKVITGSGNPMTIPEIQRTSCDVLVDMRSGKIKQILQRRFRDWKSENSLLYFVFCILVPSADCWRGLVDIDRQARDGDGWHGMPDRWGGCGAWEGWAGGWWALWQMTRDARRPRAKRPQRSAAVGFQPGRKCQHKYKHKYKGIYTMSPLEEISSQINGFNPGSAAPSQRSGFYGRVIEWQVIGSKICKDSGVVVVYEVSALISDLN